MITIFTPTYNRAYRLQTLYESLKGQTCKDFEWIVVDDGSTDDTQSLFEQWTKESSFTIKYYKQANGGKHRALNKGVSLAEGELFFVVDSDDYISNDAVYKIIDSWRGVKDKTIGGLCFRKINISNNMIIGKPQPRQTMLSKTYELEYKYGMFGDKAFIYLTSILREFPFPVFKNEKFVPEGLVYNRIDMHYSLLCIDEGIYYCEYLTDGLSANFKKQLKKNPRGFLLYYKEKMSLPCLPHIVWIKSFIRAIQCTIYKFLY